MEGVDASVLRPYDFLRLNSTDLAPPPRGVIGPNLVDHRRALHVKPKPQHLGLSGDRPEDNGSEGIAKLTASCTDREALTSALAEAQRFLLGSKRGLKRQLPSRA